jgi:hypothetical protein
VLPITWARFLAVWAAMAVAMTANGMFRELALKRIVSARVADVLSALIGIGLIAAITRVGFRPIGTTATTKSLVFASIMLVVLTVAFECALGILVDNKSWTEIAEHYAIWRGELWPIVLAFVAFTPFLWGRFLPARA